MILGGMTKPDLREFLLGLSTAGDMPMHHAADIDQFLTEAEAVQQGVITVDDLLEHEFILTLPMGPGHKSHWHCRCGEKGVAESFLLRRRAHADHAVEAIAQKASEAEQPTAAPLPRVVPCESEEALYALLSSLNNAGNHAEIACLSDLNGSPFLAGLWDVDYAGTVHYVFTEGDSGQQHCHECAGCYEILRNGKNEVVRRGLDDCDYRSPAFPIVVVLTEDPPPIDDDDPVDAWWRA
jgi:hypothetical protein